MFRFKLLTSIALETLTQLSISIIILHTLLLIWHLTWKMFFLCCSFTNFIANLWSSTFENFFYLSSSFEAWNFNLSSLLALGTFRIYLFCNLTSLLSLRLGPSRKLAIKVSCLSIMFMTSSNLKVIISNFLSIASLPFGDEPFLVEILISENKH